MAERQEIADTVLPSPNDIAQQSVAVTSTPLSFKLWNPPMSLSPHLPFEPADLEPTAAEIAAAYQAQNKRTERLLNAPLTTQRMRQQQDKARLKKWPMCAIRVRFHNQMQLEKSFPSVSNIKAVYAFVRDCLNEETKSIKFILYQPPARELKVSDATVKDKSLMELQLAPASVLLIRFLSDELNDRERLPPLQTNILETSQDLPTASGSSTVQSLEAKADKRQDRKATEQKLAKFLKLSNRK